MSTRALLLDALGTLVELLPPGPALRAELRGRFGIEVTGAEAGVAIMAEIAYYRRHFDQASDLDRVNALRAQCADALRAALPPSPRLDQVPTPALTDALLAALRFRAFSDARPALLTARGRGMRLVVASNWDVSLHGVLEHLELAPLLDGIITSAEVGARKPAVALFRRGLAMAGDVEPADAAHVGDSVEDDVKGALAAGLRPILISRHGRPAPPEITTITSLAALADVT